MEDPENIMCLVTLGDVARKYKKMDVLIEDKDGNMVGKNGLNIKDGKVAVDRAEDGESDDGLHRIPLECELASHMRVDENMIVVFPRGWSQDNIEDSLLSYGKFNKNGEILISMMDLMTMITTKAPKSKWHYAAPKWMNK